MEKNLNNIIDTMNNAVKLANNVAEIKKPDISKTDNSSNSNPNQTVQIQISDPKEKKADPKPVVIREKPETHIHKEFPDGRALSDKECELALQKAKMQHEYDMRKLDDQAYRESVEHADRIRREDIRREERKKASKRNTIIGGILAALGIGVVGYTAYSDYKLKKSGKPGMFNTTVKSAPISGEGTVE